MSYDAELLRIQDRERWDGLSNDEANPSPGSGLVSFVGKTKTVGTYPTAAARYYAIEPEVVTGAETEGASATLTVRSGTVYALNIGTAIPASGTRVLVSFVSHRWVFRYD